MSNAAGHDCQPEAKSPSARKNGAIGLWSIILGLPYWLVVFLPFVWRWLESPGKFSLFIGIAYVWGLYVPAFALSLAGGVLGVMDLERRGRRCKLGFFGIGLAVLAFMVCWISVIRLAKSS